MRTNCEGCAGCCIDWRPLASDRTAPETAGRRRPLDDAYNLVPLTRDEIATFVDRGLGDALVPRLFEPADGDDVVDVDGHALAAIGRRPAFIVGLRKPPKPVAPFGEDPHWLPTCVFLDPATLQCRIHDADAYPRTCRVYPGHNLRLGAETECERVEDAFGGARLLEASLPADLPPPRFGPTALGTTVFAYPDPADLDGAVGRLVAGTPTDADRARFVGAAVGSSPTSVEVNGDRMRDAREAVLAADSWVGRAVRDWSARATPGDAVDDVDPEALARTVEDDRGAPETPGW